MGCGQTHLSMTHGGSTSRGSPEGERQESQMGLRRLHEATMFCSIYREPDAPLAGSSGDSMMPARVK